MHIVLITHYFPPEVNAPAQRAYEHARIWVEKGHKVTIVTAAPSHPYGKLYEGYTNRTVREIDDGIHLIRLRTILGANKGVFRRSLNYFSFMWAVQSYRNQLRDADIVISTSPQFLCGLSGKAVAKAAGVAWILEIRDIWPDSIVAVGATRKNLITKLLGALAARAYRQCDKIISVSPGYKEHFIQNNIPAEKIALIPNGVTLSPITEAARFDDFPCLAPIKGRFIIGYVGTFGMAHRLLTVLRAAKAMKNRSDVGFLLVGSGAERDTLAGYIQQHNLENVVLMEQQPQQAVQKLYSLIDASIVHLKKHDVFTTVIPTKLLEAMANGKPVLLGAEGTARKILTKANAGLAFEPENSASLVEAIDTLRKSPESVKQFSANGKSYVSEHFDRRQMALKYLDVMSALLKP